MSNSKNRFSYNFRLVNPAQIRNVYEQGKKIRFGCIVVFVLSNCLDNPRICVSVSKKNVPKAVTRNRIKRLVREGFRQHCLNFNNVDIVIAISRKLSGHDEQDLREQLNKAWAKLHI